MGEGYSKDHWKKDSVVSACRSCDAKFGASNRRHHCRNCGDIFCGKCAFRTIAVPPRGIRSPVRVCDDCYMVLLEDQQNDNPQQNQPTQKKKPDSPASQQQQQNQQQQPTGSNRATPLQSEPAATTTQQLPQIPVQDQRTRKLLQKLAEIKACASESFLTMTFAIVDPVNPDDIVDFNENVDVPDTTAVPQVAFPACDKLAPQQVGAALLGPLLKRPAVNWGAIGRNAINCAVSGSSV